jgi:hypothetical protein
MFTLSAGMGFKEAQDAIGNAILNAVDRDVFFSLDYPYPDQHYPEAGKPSMTVRWDGISADANGNNPDLKVPAGFRYEVRLYHSFYGPDATITDPYKYAQEQIAIGSGELYEKLNADRSMGGLVLDIIFDNSLTGDIVEPKTNTDYYGHEALLDVRLHNE